MDLSPGSTAFFLLYEVPAVVGVLLGVWLWIKIVNHVGARADHENGRAR